MASSTLQYNQSAQLVQAYPRHPYVFCQCEGDDCSECIIEAIMEHTLSSGIPTISVELDKI